MKLYCYLTPNPKINSKWIKRSKSIKILKGNIVKNLLIIGLSNNFQYDNKITGNKTQIDKWILTKLKAYT